MSYILKALRKSDAQRRLGKSPDLGSVSALPEAHSRPSRRVPFLLGLGLTAMLSLTLAWWLHGPFLTWPGGTESDTERMAVDADSLSDGAETEPEPEEGLAVISQDARPDAEAEPDAGSAAEVIDRRSPAQRPATVVSRPAPQRAIDVPRPAAERERIVESAEEAQRLMDQARLTVQPEQQPAPIHETARSSAPASLEEPWTPERTEFMRQWELPLAVRRDLPTLNLSIHVFSAEPTGRFVLINGERRVEGDDLGQGAQLVEIRREGALVQFRDFRFLLEP